MNPICICECALITRIFHRCLEEHMGRLLEGFTRDGCISWLLWAYDHVFYYEELEKNFWFIRTCFINFQIVSENGLSELAIHHIAVEFLCSMFQKFDIMLYLIQQKGTIINVYAPFYVKVHNVVGKRTIAKVSRSKGLIAKSHQFLDCNLTMTNVYAPLYYYGCCQKIKRKKKSSFAHRLELNICSWHSHHQTRR